MYQINPTKLSTTELRFLKRTFAEMQSELKTIGCDEYGAVICDSCPYDRVCQYFRDVFISVKKELEVRGLQGD